MYKNRKLFKHHFITKLFFTENIYKYKLNLGFITKKQFSEKKINFINFYKFSNYKTFILFPELKKKNLKIFKKKEIINIILTNLNLLKYSYNLGMLINPKNISYKIKKIQKK